MSFFESMEVKSCKESGIWHASHCAHACLLCFLCKESNGVSFVNCSHYFGEAVIESLCQILTVQRPKTCRNEVDLCFWQARKSPSLRKQSHFPRLLPQPRHMVAFRLCQHSSESSVETDWIISLSREQGIGTNWKILKITPCLGSVCKTCIHSDADILHEFWSAGNLLPVCCFSVLYLCWVNDGHKNGICSFIFYFVFLCRRQVLRI